MINISTTHSRLVEISNAVLAQNLSDLTPVVIGDRESESLEDVQPLPRNLKLYSIVDTDCVPLDLKILASTFIEETCETYNVDCNVAAYYPSGSFLGWHDNRNARMYNAICTFSDTGNSQLEFVNSSNEIEVVTDNTGWTVKKSYWGDEEPVPHRVISNCNRITLTFSSENESDVDSLISTLTA